MFAPLPHLHNRRESHAILPDHAELCSQEIRENTEGNGACEALPGMIYGSACPLSCRAPHEGGRAKTPTLLERGMPIEQIQKFLGHSKLETTQLYAESSTAMMQESYQRALSR